MAFRNLSRDGEEPFYIDSDTSSEDKVPNVQITNPTFGSESERDLGTGGFRNARFKPGHSKYESSNSLIQEDRSTSFSTTASIEFDSEENISNSKQFWLKHPRIKENCKTVAAALFLFFAGFVFLIAAIALASVKENREENRAKAIIFFVCAAICIIPGAYHTIYIYRATRGERGYNFESIPSFK